MKLTLTSRLQRAGSLASHPAPSPNLQGFANLMPAPLCLWQQCLNSQASFMPLCKDKKTLLKRIKAQLCGFLFSSLVLPMFFPRPSRRYSCPTASPGHSPACVPSASAGQQSGSSRCFLPFSARSRREAGEGKEAAEAADDANHSWHWLPPTACLPPLCPNPGVLIGGPELGLSSGRRLTQIAWWPLNSMVLQVLVWKTSLPLP